MVPKKKFPFFFLGALGGGERKNPKGKRAPCHFYTFLSTLFASKDCSERASLRWEGHRPPGERHRRLCGAQRRRPRQRVRWRRRRQIGVAAPPPPPPPPPPRGARVAAETTTFPRSDAATKPATLRTQRGPAAAQRSSADVARASCSAQL